MHHINFWARWSGRSLGNLLSFVSIFRSSSSVSSETTKTVSSTDVLPSTSIGLITTVSSRLQQKESVLPTISRKLPVWSSSSVHSVALTPVTPTSTEKPKSGMQTYACNMEFPNPRLYVCMCLFASAGYRKNRQEISFDVDMRSTANTQVIKNTGAFAKPGCEGMTCKDTQLCFCFCFVHLFFITVTWKEANWRKRKNTKRRYGMKGSREGKL